MRSNRKRMAEVRELYILLYFEEGKSFRELSEEYDLLLSGPTFHQKVLRYREYGFPEFKANLKKIITSKRLGRQLF